MRGLLSDVAHGEYGKYYDAIYPAQQKLASYDQYYKCTTAALRFAKAFGLDISSLKVERAAVRPGTQSVEVPGTAERVAAVAVTV